MPCNSPNKVFYTGINNETGKKRIVFSSRNTDFIYRYSPHDRWIMASDGSPALFRSRGYQVITDGDLVPCGQCLGCRLDYARQWSARLMCEKKNYPDDLCWFVTLTYDDEHLPERRYSSIPNKETGEYKLSDFRSVDKRTHQLFMKRLRKHFQPKTNLKIRYFMSGEYGTLSARPHYHYIIFGLKLDDLHPYKNNLLGDALYTSDELSRCWTDDNGCPIGFVTVGSVTVDSCGYVARYALKKQKMTTKETYEKLGIEPEFVCMSRRPGIGKDYFDSHVETMFLTDELILPGRDRPVKMKPPKYFDTLLESLDQEKYDSIKENRKEMAKLHDEFISEYMPFLDKEVQLKTKERKLKHNTMSLQRRNIDG